MAVAETADLWLARQSADKEMIELTLNDSLAGVKFLAGRLANRLPAHVDVEDLIQVGLMGLLQCAQRYDSDRGVKFQTYANRRVQGAMLDYLRSLDWSPRSVRKRSRRMAQAVAAVEQRTGESASEEELAAEMGMSSLELREWFQDYCSRGEHSTIHFNERRKEENSEDLLALIADPADSPETAVEKTELCGRLSQAIEKLPENERIVLQLYYYEQRTMREIGRTLGVKQARVSQLHSQALRRLRLRLRREALAYEYTAPPIPPATLPVAASTATPSQIAPSASNETHCTAPCEADRAA
ncbi:MAG: FliA/WhiG family RNA polymerase sigma factor [Acidobacteria bacterium]|nr:FliA/WhiG family RNA polymerase sigma factor [Acidobacteriota bacterium]